MYTSYKQRAELCVSGYVRNESKEIDELNIPKEIIQLILLFYLLKIEAEMRFDKDNVGTDIEILSDHKIRFRERTNGSKPYMAARFCYGISLNKSEYANIKYISWKVKLTTQSPYFWNNCMPFIGVVSNRTTDFDTNPFSSQTLLIDAYGIGADHYCVYDASKTKDRDHNLMDDDMNYPGMDPTKWVTVKYMIDETKLVFENLKEDKIYGITLPNDIDGINKWYPAIGLRFANDECEIKDIIVE